jgi:transposase
MAAERHESLRLFVVASQEQGQLSELLMRRADLLAIQVAEKNRAGHPRYTEATETVRQSLAASLDFLTAQIALFDDQIKALVATAPELHARFKIMTSVIGVGDKTALLLQGLLPELGYLTRRQAASLAGCAPHPRDSGLTRGHRSVFGGRALVKRALFTAAMSARTHDPAMREFFERLTKAGKPKMVALVAIMRKIIVQINAKLRPPAIAPSW